MIYRPKNKNTETLTSKIYKQQKGKEVLGSKRVIPTKPSGIRFKQIQMATTAKSDPEIINRLQRHIEYLQKQLKACDQAIMRANSINDSMKESIRQKELENRNLFKSIESYQESIKSISAKFEELQSNYDNLKLQQSMDGRSEGVSEQKEGQKKIELKHRLYKKGNYSAAFLPAAFGSAQKFEKHKKSQYNLVLKEEQIDEVESSRVLLRNPMSGYLIDEWQKSTTQKNIKQKQLSLLEVKVMNLKKEIVKHQKQMERLNAVIIQKQKKEKHLNFQLNNGKDKLKNSQKENKFILDKLKGAQQKIVQLTVLLKQKKEITAIETAGTAGTDRTVQMNEDDKFYNHSSIEEIRSMIERINYNLQIQNCTVDTWIDPQCKQQTGIQTSQDIISVANANQKVISLQILIRQLQDQILMKQLQYKTKLDEENQHFQQQIKEYIQAIEEYKFKIEEYSFMVRQYEAERDNWIEIEKNKNPEQNKIEKIVKKIKLVDANAQCDIVPSDFCDQREQILQKAKILIEFNQEQANTIKQLNCQIQRMREDNEEKYAEPTSQNVDETETINTKYLSEDKQNKDKDQQYFNDEVVSIDNAKQSEQQSILSQKIKKLKQERDYFSECYSQALTNFKNIQLEYQRQTSKIKQEQEEKQRQVNDLLNELAEKTQQLHRLKQEIQDCETKIKVYQDDADGYKLQIHELNELCRTLQMHS